MEPRAKRKQDMPPQYVIRASACLNQEGVCCLQEARHFVYEEGAKYLDISIDSNSTNSPRWRLHRSRLDGNDLDTITLFTARNLYNPWPVELFNIENIERLPVQGRYVVGATTWCTPAQSSKQLARLRRVIGAWVDAQARFFDQAGGFIREDMKDARNAHKTSPSTGNDKFMGF